MAKRDQVPKDIQAHQAIKRLMFDRRLAPGQKIIFRDLEETLGMSKTPITSALVRLELEGLVVSVKNRGYFVKELAEDEIHQLYEMRIKLEQVAIDLAIANYQEEDLVKWRELLNKYKAHQDVSYDNVRFQLDVDLHAHLAKMGRNVYLTKIIDQFFVSTWAVLQTAYLAGRIGQFSNDHERLFKAVRDRESQKAKDLTEIHHQAAMEAALLAVRR